MVTRSTIFKSNKSQAVRLPKAVAFPDDVHQVEIIKVGNTRVIAPAGKGWEYYFRHGTPVTDDFMMERNQPKPQERESL